MDSNKLRIVLHFQRLDIYGRSENINLFARYDMTLLQFKERIFMKLNVDVSR